ncbi:hypothetical protein MMC07_003343 [Pseudocyphellaria aurata]|nr:hypothetical protein [Pseudocyphellaria aurata]
MIHQPNHFDDMSNVRNLISLGVVTTIGVYTGVAIFNPAFKELQKKKKQEQRLSDSSSSSIENIDPTCADSTSRTLSTETPRPVEDLGNVKSDGQDP